MNGLLEEIKVELEMFFPRMLEEVMARAMQVEKKSRILNGKWGGQLRRPNLKMNSSPNCYFFTPHISLVSTSNNLNSFQTATRPHHLSTSHILTQTKLNPSQYSIDSRPTINSSSIHNHTYSNQNSTKPFQPLTPTTPFQLTPNTTASTSYPR